MVRKSVCHTTSRSPSHVYSCAHARKEEISLDLSIYLTTNLPEPATIVVRVRSRPSFLSFRIALHVAYIGNGFVNDLCVYLSFGRSRIRSGSETSSLRIVQRRSGRQPRYVSSLSLSLSLSRANISPILNGYAYTHHRYVRTYNVRYSSLFSTNARRLLLLLVPYPGETVYVVGNHPALGGGDVSKGVALYSSQTSWYVYVFLHVVSRRTRRSKIHCFSITLLLSLLLHLAHFR